MNEPNQINPNQPADVEQRRSLRPVIVALIIFLALAVAVGLFVNSKTHKVPKTDKEQLLQLTKQLVQENSNYRQAPDRKKPQVLEKMVDLSKQRKEQMAALIKKEPDLAVRVAFDEKARELLPNEIQANIEEQVTLAGNLEVSHWDDFENKKAGFYYSLNAKGIKSNLYPTGENVEALTNLANEEITVSGIIIGKDVAVEKVSGNTQVKGEVLGALDQTVLVMVLNNAVSVSSANNMVITGANSVNNFYQQNSFGKMSFSGKAVGYTVSIPSSCNYSQIQSLAFDAATAAGENLNSYQKKIIIFPYKSDCGWSGLGQIGSIQSGTTAWINGAASLNLFVIGHEMGHNFGAFHANYYNCYPVSIKSTGCNSNEYGDWYSIMGGGVAQHNAYHKEKMSFFNSSDSLQVNSSGTYTLNDYYGSAGGKIIKIPRDTTSGNITTWLYLEYRPELSGVLIRYARKYSDGGDSQLIDASPESKYPDAQLKTGRVFEDRDKGIRVQIASISSAQVSLDIQIPPVAGCTRIPPTMVVSPTVGWGTATSTLNYSATVTNNDNLECGSSSFSLSYLLQAGFTASFAPPLLSLAPGTSGTSTLGLTSPASATVGNIYDAILTATNLSSPTLFSSKVISYGVLAPNDNIPSPTPSTAPSSAPSPSPSPVLQTDTDGDGCTDTQELGSNELLGGRRDPNNRYDFFDMPLPAGPPGTGVRDKVINSADIEAVISKYGTYLGGPAVGGQVYNADFDRTYVGPDPWDLGPGDGRINISDIVMIINQYGHSCL